MNIPSRPTVSRSVSRRSITQGLAWSVPAVAAVSAAPFAAASVVTASGGEYGLFVSTQMNGGYVGYSGSNNTGAIRATSPSAYFAAVKSGNNPESDINWNDASGCRTSTSYVNGEGSFTPVTNSATGANGAYASTSGFWWSVPTTSPNTGTGYIAGSTATLASGATFTTQIEVIIPAGTNATWTANNITIAGQTWNKALSGTRTTTSASAPYLASSVVAGTWSVTAPTITTLADGSVKVTGTITYKTTIAYKVTQTGTKYYGQTEIMPATIQVNPAYGWTSFTLTSSVQSATISYTGQPAGAPSTVTLANQLLTTSTVTPKAC